MLRPLTAILALLLLAAAGPAVAAGKRVALVIGNNAYENIVTLQKAANDADAMGDALEELGFTVTRALNVSRRDMNRALNEFTAAIDAGDSAMLFYAGHGIEIDGLNYLLPVDVPDAGEGQADFISAESLALDDIMARLRERNARLNLIVLDACRNNPFGRSGTRSIGGGAGLARIAAPQGTFVMYSADIGETALDRLSEDDPNPNSVFTRALIPLMRTPGLDLVDTAREVRRRVRDLAVSVSHQQTPAYYDAVLGDFYFAGPIESDAKAELGAGATDIEETNSAAELPQSAEAPARAMILTGGEKDSIRLWDAEAGSMIGELQGEKFIPSAIRFADNGNTVMVATKEGALFFYSVPDFKKRNALYPGFTISAMAQTRNATLLLGGADGTLAAVDPASGESLWKVQTHADIISPIIVDEGDATVLTASGDGTVAMSDLASGRVKSRASTVAGKAITDIQRITKTTVVAVHEDGTVAYLDLAADRVLARFRGNKGWISSVGLGPDGTRFATAGVDGDVAIWTVGAQSPDRILAAHGDVATVAKFIRTDAGNRLISAGFDGLIKLWDGEGSRLLAQMDHGSAILYFDQVDSSP
jgi:Caspase domain/PQQ-like domain